MNENTNVGPKELYIQMVAVMLSAATIGLVLDLSLGTSPSVLYVEQIPTVTIPSMQVVYVDFPVIISPGFAVVYVASFAAFGYTIWKFTIGRQRGRE